MKSTSTSRTGAWLLTAFITLVIHCVLCLWTMSPQQRGGFGGYLMYQTSYLAGLTLVSVGLTRIGQLLTRHLPPAARWIRWMLAWLGSIGLGAFTLAPDLENLSVRLGGDNAPLVVWVLVAGVAAVPLFAFLIASRLISASRKWIYPVGIAACGLLVVDEFILEKAYISAHLYLFITGFSLLYLALPSPGFIQRWATPLLVVLGLLAGYSFWAPPGNRVRLTIASIDSASMAKFVSRIQGKRTASTEADSASNLPSNALHSAHPEWFTPRPLSQFSSAPFENEGIVILVTIDALRADLFTVPRRARDVRAFTQIAREGTYFRNVFSPSTTTRFALGAMFTGTDTTRLNWYRRSISQPVLTKDNPALLTEQLQADGVRTIVGIPNPHQYGAKSGFALGIDELERFKPPKKQRYAPAQPVITWMLERLSRVKKGERVFMYTHLLDPHAPYNSVKAKGSKFNRYLAEVREVGEQMTRLWKGINELGLRDRVVFIVSADHGESFGRHGQYQHNNVAYEDSAKVPLIVVGPGVKQQSIQETISLTDLTPTILELFGTASAHSMNGRSLTPTLVQGTPPVQHPQISANYKSGAVLFPDHHKLIVQHELDTVELYDIEEDPQEKENLCLADAVLCETYRAAADRVKGGPWPGRER